MNTALTAWAHRQWQRRGWLALLLRPLSCVTRQVAAARRQAFLSGRNKPWRAPVPVVVIGNLYVGGTGKTPIVIATVDGLRGHGWTPGVISRGYGARRAAAGTPRVGCSAALPASDYGDEPALIARATGAPVAVHPDRALAARMLLEKFPEVNVIISDDGLQHYALARDVEIVAQDERGVGNGLLLPAGPLREPPERLRHVDAIITKLPRRAPPDGGACDPPAPRDGPQRYTMQISNGAARRLIDGTMRALDAFSTEPDAGGIAAAAGIGNPMRFFDALREAGVPLAETLALPDHYAYRSSPFQPLRARHILITPKDAIKCAALRDPRLWEVPAVAHLTANGPSPLPFADWLSETITRKTGARP